MAQVKLEQQQMCAIIPPAVHVRVQGTGMHIVRCRSPLLGPCDEGEMSVDFL